MGAQTCKAARRNVPGFPTRDAIYENVVSHQRILSSKTKANFRPHLETITLALELRKSSRQLRAASPSNFAGVAQIPQDCCRPCRLMMPKSVRSRYWQQLEKLATELFAPLSSSSSTCSERVQEIPRQFKHHHAAITARTVLQGCSSA